VTTVRLAARGATGQRDGDAAGQVGGGLAGFDAIVVGVVPGPDGPVPAAGAGYPVHPAVLRARGVTGHADEITVLGLLGPVPGAGRGLGAGPGPVVVAAGLGATPGADDLRRAAGAAVRSLAGTARVALALPLGDPGRLRAAAEGALLGGYEFAGYRTVSTVDIKPAVGTVTLLVDDPADGEGVAALRRARTVAAAVRLARDLVNTPPSDLYPAALAEVAREQCRGPGITVEILDEEALRAGGFGGIAGVGRGSHHPPRLVHLSYRRGEPATTVALAGKGITFDSGGISLKDPAGMHEMKMDMAGAAAVIATVRAVAELELPVAVEAWVPAAENMPGGGAIRPSDVLMMRDGRRVEVVDTDNEGRLILADAIARACEDRPDVVLDIATLTSAQIVALGRVAGVMANDDALREAVVGAADRAGEAAWGMPLPPYLRRELDSDIADIANRGTRPGGMLAAGLFLREFVAPGVRWAHIDIAGPAYHSGSAFGYTPRGGTGAGVRLLVQLIDELSSAPIIGR
jgi:leucyl aminopeptidase